MQINSLKIKALMATAALILAISGVVSAQTPPPTPPKTEMPVKIGKPKARPAPKIWVSDAGGGTYEKSIVVDPRVSVSLCVTEGNVKVNGWGRNEVRVFIKEGSKISFDILQKSPKNESPVWIKVVGFDPEKPKTRKECIWGSEVEVDVPSAAAVNIEGKETRTTVDSIRKVSVKNAGGDIFISNVTEGANASTYEGSVTVENSEGMITLASGSGNIIAFEAGPSQVGDTFKAKTNSGAIALQNVKHREVEVNSISGSILFNGNLLSGGLYSFGTSNGSISLSVPPDSPCFMSATYGYGNFNSEIPIKIITENVSPGPIKSVKGILGKGDCKLNLTTSSGFIRIKKQ